MNGIAQLVTAYPMAAVDTQEDSVLVSSELGEAGYFAAHFDKDSGQLIFATVGTPIGERIFSLFDGLLEMIQQVDSCNFMNSAEAYGRVLGSVSASYTEERRTETGELVTTSTQTWMI